MRVRELFIYPIKGLPGCRMETIRMDCTGPLGDRRYMITDANGRFISQREFPQLANLKLEIRTDNIEITNGVDSLELHKPSLSGEVSKVKVWDDTVEAIDCGAQASDFFTNFLGQPVRLVYMHMDGARLTGGATRYADQPVSFADACPILVVNSASLDFLAKETGIEISPLRFRPNIVVECEEAWVEDHWPVLGIGSCQLQFIKTCGRCQVINIDPSTGNSGQEPLRTLSKIRKSENRVIFGTYYRCMQIGSSIMKGEEVVLL